MTDGTAWKFLTGKDKRLKYQAEYYRKNRDKRLKQMAEYYRKKKEAKKG